MPQHSKIESSPDLNMLNNMICENDDSRKSGSFHRNSKRIYKNKFSDSESFAIMTSDEKINDKGDYIVIHRLNKHTKRMN